MTQTQHETHSEIEWRAWAEDAFADARREKKLILLDSGATWCHWCHVMDHVTYEDPDVADLVGTRYIPVRIDRDRQPDLDAWLQRTPTVIRSGGQGGWPLTVILTPDAVPLWKATFLPPHGGGEYGPVPGLVDVLQQVDEAWREDHDNLRRTAENFRRQVTGQSDAIFCQPGKLNNGLVARIAADIVATYDPEHGGFDGAPKFFSVPAMELLLMRGWGGDAEARAIVRHSLAAIADGGVHDHLAGGFHRYSVDAGWHVPHFEKMACDNAGLLKLYASAHALTGEEAFADVARDIVQWVRRDLASDGEGFYASQDADTGPDDDGDFFTWTRQEVRDALGEDAEPVLQWYGLSDEGDMDSRPGRNVLHVTRSTIEVAEMTGRSVEDVREAVRRAKETLLSARQRRTTPAVDKTVFADLNGMLMSALLEAAGYVGEDDWAKLALEHLDMLLASHRSDGGVFGHYVEDGELRNVGLLTDQAWMLRTLLAAFQWSGRGEYLRSARMVGDFIVDRLVAADGGFVSRPADESEGPTSLSPRRSWEDAPSQSASSVAVIGLADLGYITGEKHYADTARRALESFAGGIEKGYGTFLGGYAMAVDRMLHGPRSVVLVAHTPPAELREMAYQTYLPHKLTLLLQPAAEPDQDILDSLGYAPAPDGPVAYVCEKQTCLAPATSPEQLRQRFSELQQR